jgi:hypothetical protein
LALKTVNGKVTNVAGGAIVLPTVSINLSQPAVIPGTQEFLNVPILPVVAGDGSYSVQLQANGDLTPANTYYTITESSGGGSIYTFTVIVPQTAGPFVMSSLVVVPPAPLFGGTSATINPAGDIAARSLTVGASSPYNAVLPGNAAVATPAGVVTGNVWNWGGGAWNPKAAGAKGDGVTNDCVAFQAAGDAASAAGGGAIEPSSGVYIINGAGIQPKSNCAWRAAPGSVVLKRTVAGDVFVKTGAQAALDRATWEGLDFDLNNQGWSSIDLIGSDANGQLTNITIRDCRFKNPNNTWMVQIQYTIADPVIPTLKNRNIRIDNCIDDSSGQTSSLESWIITNCQDVVVQNSRFLNAPVSLAANFAVYGYCKNVRFIDNYIENWACPWGVYVVQSDSVQFLGDNFRTTGTQICAEVFNSKDVSFMAGTYTTAPGGGGVQIHDFSGATFDGHTNLYSASSGVRVQGVRMDGMDTCVSLNCDQVQGQSDIFVEANLVSPRRQLFSSQGMPIAPSATVKRVFIRGNHVISHSAISPNNCIDIFGNASATNGGWQTVVIADNLIPTSGSSGGDISIQNLADDVTITGNRCMSPTPLSIPAAVTNLRIKDNVGGNQGIGGVGIMQAPNQTVGATALIASVAALTVQNDGAAHVYRVSGGVTITTLGSGVINVQVTYRDAGGNNRTHNIPLSTTAGTLAASANTADDWSGSVIIQVNPLAAITISTAGTFTGCTYNAWGLIEQLK